MQKFFIALYLLAGCASAYFAYIHATTTLYKGGLYWGWLIVLLTTSVTMFGNAHLEWKKSRTSET